MSAFLQQVRADAPVGLWLPGYVSGTTVSDLGSGGNNGTTVNAPSVVPGLGFPAMTLNGTNQRVNLGTPAGLQLQTYTICALVKHNRAIGASEPIMAAGSSDAWAVGRGFDLFVSSTGKTQFRKGSGDGSFEAVAGATTVPNGEWMYLTGVNLNTTGAGSMLAYLNGDLDGTASSGDTAATSYANITGIWIGFDDQGTGGPDVYGSFTVGLVAIFNSVLTAARIKAQAKAALRGGVTY